jgi:hypothetical protein
MASLGEHEARLPAPDKELPVESRPCLAVRLMRKRQQVLRPAGRDSPVKHLVADTSRGHGHLSPIGSWP